MTITMSLDFSSRWMKAHGSYVAFEVGNLDDLMAGHEYLKRRNVKTSALTDDIFWEARSSITGKLNFGLIHEHWTDTDLLNDQHQAGDCAIGKMRDYWGPEPTPAFLVSRWNFKVIKNLVRILKARSRTSAGSDTHWAFASSGSRPTSKGFGHC